MLIASLDCATALHLAIALRDHRNRCRADGTPLPATLDELARLAWDTAKGASEGQDGTTLADLAAMLHAPRVSPLLLTFDQAAALLAVSARTVKRYVAEGLLPVVHLGASARILHEDLERFVADLGPRPMRQTIEVKDTPASCRQMAAAGRREAGAGVSTPAGTPASLPRGVA
jgi:excisionase family DNA binding protein